MASLADEIAQLRAGVELTQVSGYAIVAGLTVIGYDCMITFADEIKHIWSTRLSWQNFLYVFARYYGLLHMVLSTVVRLSPNPSFNICQVWRWFWSLSGPVVFVGVVNILLVMRIHALYGRKRWVLLSLIPIVFIEFACELPVIVLSLRAITVLPKPLGIPILGCLQQVPDQTKIQLVAWMSALFTSLVFFVLTSVKFLQVVKNTTFSELGPTRRRWAIAPVLTVFVRDGALFFAAIFAVVLVTALFNTVIKGPQSEASLYWLVVVYSVSASRLIVNLRVSLSRPHSMMEYELSPISPISPVLSGGMSGISHRVHFADAIAINTQQQKLQKKKSDPYEKEW